MNLRNLAIAVGIAAAAVITTVLIPEANADRTIVLSTSAARVSHGDFHRLEDAGWRFTVCAATTQTDGGTARPDEPCVKCEPGAFSNAPAACLAAWKAANGL